MIQLGGILSGYALFTLFTWMPIWGMASAASAEALFHYFVVVMMLVFGVFLVAGGKNRFSLLRFFPSFIAGCVLSYGFSLSLWWLMAAGAVMFVGFWLFAGE